MRGRAASTEHRERLRTPEQVFTLRDTRRDGDRELPLGPKARRTRGMILRAAAQVFGEKGYQRSTVADVAEAAEVSLGTVYQYFRDRADLVAALVRSSLLEMRRGADVAWRMAEGRDGLHRVITAFVRSYHEHPDMARVWEEVTFAEPELGELRRSLGRVFTGSVERELQRAVDAGEVRAGLDPALTARALTGMVDRYCLVTYVLDPPAGGPPAPEESADLLVDLWLAAIAP